jgi:hypothetical protein
MSRPLSELGTTGSFNGVTPIYYGHGGKWGYDVHYTQRDGVQVAGVKRPYLDSLWGSIQVAYCMISLKRACMFVLTLPLNGSSPSGC